MPDSSQVVLPPFFPLVRKGCERVSSDFFQCLTDRSEPLGDSAIAVRALRSCEDMEHKYIHCTKASLSVKGATQPIVLTDWETE